MKKLISFVFLSVIVLGCEAKKHKKFTVTNDLKVSSIKVEWEPGKTPLLERKKTKTKELAPGESTQFEKDTTFKKDDPFRSLSRLIVVGISCYKQDNVHFPADFIGVIKKGDPTVGGLLVNNSSEKDIFVTNLEKVNLKIPAHKGAIFASPTTTNGQPTILYTCTLPNCDDFKMVTIGKPGYYVGLKQSGLFDYPRDFFTEIQGGVQQQISDQLKGTSKYTSFVINE